MVVVPCRSASATQPGDVRAAAPRRWPRGWRRPWCGCRRRCTARRPSGRRTRPPGRRRTPGGRGCRRSPGSTAPPSASSIRSAGGGSRRSARPRPPARRRPPAPRRAAARAASRRRASGSLVTSSPMPVTEQRPSSATPPRSPSASVARGDVGRRSRCRPSRTTTRPSTTTSRDVGGGRGEHDRGGRVGRRAGRAHRVEPHRDQVGPGARRDRRPASGQPSAAWPAAVAAPSSSAGVEVAAPLGAQPLVHLHAARLLEQVDHGVAVGAEAQRRRRRRPARRAGPMPSARSRSVVGHRQTPVPVSPSSRCGRRR